MPLATLGPFTGQLGTAASGPGNIELGLGPNVPMAALFVKGSVGTQKLLAGTVGTKKALQGGTLMAKLQDLGGVLGSGAELFAGEDIYITDTIVAADITTWSGNLVVRKAPNGPTLLTKPWAVSNGPSGILTVTVAAADSGTTLGPGKWRYEIERADSGQNTVLTYGQLWLLAKS